MSAPPPYLDPSLSRRRLRSRLLTAFLATLGVANVIAAMHITATQDFPNAIVNAFIAILCLLGAAIRLWRIHSRIDRRL